MSLQAPASRREEDLAFFGAVTASLSHQINNVFTIVNELNGLVEDILQASGQSRPIPPDRLKAAAEKIGRNVGRGTEYVRLLNRFAHAADHPEAQADLGETLRLFEGISARFLELNQRGMTLQLPPQPVPVKTAPFTLLHALFVCLRGFLDGGEGKEPIRLAACVQEGRTVVSMEGPAPPDGGSGLERRLDLLGRLANELGSTALYSAQGGIARFELALPRSENGVA